LLGKGEEKERPFLENYSIREKEWEEKRKKRDQSALYWKESNSFSSGEKFYGRVAKRTKKG